MSFRLFLLWTFVLVGRPQDFFTFLIPLRIVLILVLLTLITSVIDGTLRLAERPFLVKERKLYILLFGLMVIGILFSTHRGRSFEAVILGYFSNVLYFFVATLQIRDTKRLHRTAVAICAGVAAYTTFSLINGISQGGRFAFGRMFDPNDLAYYYVSFFPICFYVMHYSRSQPVKWMAVFSTFLSPVLILMTGSRGGILGLLIVVLLFFFSKAAKLKRIHKILVTSVVILLTVGFSSSIDFSRIQSFSNLKEDYNLKSDTGRLEVWKTGFQIIARHPITGVGVYNFAREFADIRRSEGRAPVWKTAHNSFILIAAEAGIPALLIYVSLIAMSLKNFKRLSKRSSIQEEVPSFPMLCGMLYIGFCGSLVCAFFLSQAYSFLFTIFFAMSAITRSLEMKYLQSNEARTIYK